METIVLHIDTATSSADIVTTKTDGSTTYTPGDTVTYTITVHNNGPSDATSVVVSDPLPANIPSGNVTWSGSNGTSGSGALSDTIATLVNQTTVTYTVNVLVPSDYTGDLVNTVSVTSPTTDPSPTCTTCTDTDTPAPSADIVTVKLMDKLP